MLERKITNLMISKCIISDDEIETFQYGVEIAFIKMIHTLTIFMIGLLSRKLIEMILFVAIFSLLRSCINGYHSKTKMGCLIISIFMAMGLIISLSFLSLFKNMNFLIIIVTIVLLIFFVFLINLPANRLRAITIVTILCILSIVLSYFNLSQFIGIITYCVLLAISLSLFSS